MTLHFKFTSHATIAIARHDLQGQPRNFEHHGFVSGTGASIDDVMTPAGGAESSGRNPPPPPPYSEANSPDPPDVNVIVDGIKVPYDVTDPVYWFRRLEIRMQTVGIGSQF